MCALTAPALFDQDSEDGLVLVLREHPEPEQIEALKKVVALCPSGALSLGDDETMSEQLYAVAEYIKSLCDKMKGDRGGLFGGCGQYSFSEPGENAPTTVTAAAPPQQFPGR